MASSSRLLSTSAIAQRPTAEALLERVKEAERFKDDVASKPAPNAPQQELAKGGKGAEGVHYFDAVRPTGSTVYDLADTSKTGNWTLINPIYTDAELDAVKVVHRETQTLGDKAAFAMVKLARTLFDFVTFYRHKPMPVVENPKEALTVQQLREGGYILSDKQWLMRILFLESIAGVPGMVASVLRHLRSLRLMRRDGGWIHTLLSEAENERMHLLTFMTIKQPSIFFRAAVLGAQGVFWNVFFLSYLVSPKACHRFVGYLEEEACITYTRCIEDMEKGYVPEWENMPAPKIAIDYWRLKDDAKLIDVIRAVRADEAQHRFVNHSLANLDQKKDFNPFAIREPDATIRGTIPGFTREEAAAFAKSVHEEEQKAKLAARQ